MNTTAKGESFELKIKKKVEDLLEHNEFSIAGKFYRVFHKKGYYSEKRKGNIVVDISVEFRRTQRANPSVYFFIECKDYNTPVPVNDVEEFYTKVGQISGVNAKAFLFTTSSIQEGGLNFARSVGMAIVRVLDDDSLAWLVECTNKELMANNLNATSANIMNALINEYFVSTKRDTFGYVNGFMSYDLKDIFNHLLNMDVFTQT